MDQSQLATRREGARLGAVATKESPEGATEPDRPVADAAPAAAPDAEYAPERAEDRPLVLVADDDPDVLELVVGRIEAMGFEVVSARDGGEALKIAVERNPSIAILDVAMPQLDGLEVTRRLRAHGEADGVAVILLTARVAEADVIRGFEAGAEDYIRKPFSLRELTEAVKRKEERRLLRRREQATRRMAGEQAALREVATAVAAEATPREVFALVAERAGTTLGADAGAVLRLGDAPAAARVVGAWEVDGRRAPRLGELLPVPSDRTDPLAALAVTAAALLEGHENPPVAVAPIRVGDTTWGAVVIASIGAPFHPEVEDCLPRFAELVALTIANADARHHLTTLASVDGLTGLLNQRSFKERLGVEVQAARRHGRPLSLALLDVDHFKRVNDVYGHAVGDQVLAEVARRLTAAARAGETIARVGGEEFAWVLPATEGVNAHAAAERARRAVSARPFPVVGRLTLSAGVAELGAPAGDAEELFRLADVALYWAKGRGRDTSLRYSPELARSCSEAAERAGREREQALAGIRALAAIVDEKSPATHGHSERVAELARMLALACGWSHDRAALLREVALVHDVGKIGLADAILLKPGPLDPEERRLIRAHPVVGARMVEGLLSDEQASWLRHHHERFAGGGYPDGLRGLRIPLGARLLAIADAWDAMTSDRVYQRARTPAEALEECRREAGGHFCPQGVAALGRLWEAGQITTVRAAGDEGM
jgi:diguanylate cyclase (GGDEF)-like protein